MFETIANLISGLGALIIAIIMTIIYFIYGTPRAVDTPVSAGSSTVDRGTVNTPVSAGSSTTYTLGGCESCNDTDSSQPLRLANIMQPDRHSYKFLSFNVEYEAAGYSPDEVVEIINSLGADVIVLNEAHEIEGKILQTDRIIEGTSKISDALSRVSMNHVYSHDWAIIASTRSITQPYKGTTTAADNKYLDTAALIDGSFYVLSAHLTDYPYQPFQLAHIPYCYDKCQTNICPRSRFSHIPITGNATVGTESCSATSAENQMIEQASLARGADIDLIISAINVLERESLPILLAGDFNEPSHLDWTDDTVAAGQQPLRVRYPTSSRLVSAGMTDLFRAVHPDPTKNPGYTWPARPLTREYLSDLSQGKITEQIPTPTDRIDFIYGTGVRALSADVVVTPSDHNAVVAEFEILPR